MARRVKRVVTCQGTIQLVTALTMLRHRQQEQQGQELEYEDYLVIYELKTPVEQIDRFAEFIQIMAKQAGHWQKIVYIRPEQLAAIAKRLNLARLNLHSIDRVYSIVHQLTGTATADEIYLAKNFELGNQLLINAYQSGEKICYGDSMGIYLPQTSSVFVEQKSLINTAKNLLKTIGIKKTLMPQINFDIGYFTLPDIFDSTPPMQTVRVDRSEMLKVFQTLRGLLSTEYATRIRQKLADRPVSVLLTSNFSEASRMSEENEIAAYREFLQVDEHRSHSVLLIKPHPRDGSAKIEKLQSALKELFVDIVVLSDPSLFFLPFEIFFLEVFLNQQLELQREVTVFTVSSACISLKLLFDLPCKIGYGQEITSRMFYDNHVDSRLQHERELVASLQRIQQM